MNAKTAVAGQVLASALEWGGLLLFGSRRLRLLQEKVGPRTETKLAHVYLFVSKEQLAKLGEQGSAVLLQMMEEADYIRGEV